MVNNMENKKLIRKEKAEKAIEKTKKLAANAGSFVEETVGGFIERREEAPLLVGEPTAHVWYRIPVPYGISGDGT